MWPAHAWDGTPGRGGWREARGRVQTLAGLDVGWRALQPSVPWAWQLGRARPQGRAGLKGSVVLSTGV